MSEQKKTIADLIKVTAEETARSMLQIQQRSQSVNYYRATEDLLRIYGKLKWLLEHPEDYGFFPSDKSHDITVAPSPGTGFMEPVDIETLFVESRKKSFIRTMSRFFDLQTVIKSFDGKREFLIIRMYYFNEDENGEDRGQDAKRYTFPEIAEALENIGIEMSEKAVRRCRTDFVKDMTIMLFGMDGAISIESTGSSQGARKDEKNSQVEDIDSE